MKTFAPAQELEFIKKWNEVVGKDDTVIYAGDFVDSTDKNDLLDVRRQLNGKIILVKGNHDTFPDNAYKEAFDDVVSSLDLNDINVSIAHSSCKDIRPGWKRIYGHFHRGVDPYLTNASNDSFCCCVSRNNGYPIKLVKALALMYISK